MAQREASGEEVRTIDTVRSEEPEETDTDVETEAAAEVDESGDALPEPEVVAAAAEQASDPVGESGMPDAGPEEAPATEEILIGGDVVADSPPGEQPIHETAPLQDEGDEPSAA